MVHNLSLLMIYSKAYQLVHSFILSSSHLSVYSELFEKLERLVDETDVQSLQPLLSLSEKIESSKEIDQEDYSQSLSENNQ